MRDHELDAHRARETPAGAMIALADPGLSALLALWPLARIRVVGDGSPATWAELWDSERVAVDVAHVATLLGTDLNNATRIVERAIELRVVYPDGTIHAAAEELLGKKLELWKRVALGQKPEIPEGVGDDIDGGTRASDSDT